MCAIALKAPLIVWSGPPLFRYLARLETPTRQNPKIDVSICELNPTLPKVGVKNPTLTL